MNAWTDYLAVTRVLNIYNCHLQKGFHLERTIWRQCIYGEEVIR
jgi:hypothetical protein